MKILIKIFLIIVFIPLIGGYGLAVYDLFQRIFGAYKEHSLFLFGVVGGIFSFPLFQRRGFIRTFEHEMSHLIFAKLFLAKVKRLNVTDEGSGFVEYSSSSNPFIGLAPYFFPLYSALISALIPIINPDIAKYFFLPVGFFLSQHLIFSIKEIFSSQPDLKEEGLIFSIFFVMLFLLIFYGIIISSVISIKQILPFIKNGAESSFFFAKVIFSIIVNNL